tara:strand:- start:4308 stop:4661 length:354 start_codon:yes stop_codon:yes gene_type:complete
MKLNSKKDKRLKIRKRIRSKLFGTSSVPRLAVFRSNNEIYAQIINDEKGQTLFSSTSLSSKKEKLTKTEMAKRVGAEISDKALKKGIKKVVFDRGGFVYHGRIKALADSARENGLKF